MLTKLNEFMWGLVWEEGARKRENTCTTARVRQEERKKETKLYPEGGKAVTWFRWLVILLSFTFIHLYGIFSPSFSIPLLSSTPPPSTCLRFLTFYFFCIFNTFHLTLFDSFFKIPFSSSFTPSLPTPLSPSARAEWSKNRLMIQCQGRDINSESS